MRSQTSMLLVLVTFLAFDPTAFAADHPELKAFPLAKEGQERFVIVLPRQERNEKDNFMVEIIVGKTMLTDGVNHYGFGEILARRALENGKGHHYYEVKDARPISTLIGVPKGTPEVKKFVSATPLQDPYDSRVPIVVYAPKGFEVRYRIWEASETTKHAEKR